jgi:hypothetical protein
MSTATAPAPVSTIAYGVELLSPTKLPEHIVELYFFKNAPALQDGTLIPRKGGYVGEGRMWHAQKLCQLLLGKSFDMHEWTVDQLQLFCDFNISTVAGPAAGGKTTTAAIFALLFWLCDPLDSAVIVTSTTLQGLKKRIWGEILKAWRKLSWLSDTAKLVESKTCIQAQPGDETHGIFGIAVAGGQTEKALGRIIGFHPKRLLVIVDEMTDTPEAIVDACVNLSKTEGEFRFIGIGNPKSRLDPHGKMSKPKAGWKSINVESEFWETEEGGCLHLDGFKSPNIKAGRDKYPYLIKQKDIDGDIRKYGANSPKVWRFDRGFWAPDDVEQKVITESMFEQFPRCTQPAVWVQGFRRIGALDVATGGDRCMLRFGRYGLGSNGVTLIEFTEAIPLKLDASTNEPIHYQIARLTREACKQRGVEPECFGLDTTGVGSGTADILQREWSMRIHRVNFNDRPSDRVVSDTNPNKCSAEYYNFVTELWFAVRRFLESDQLRGITEDDIFEFASRNYEMKGNLYQVDPKDVMKSNIGRSPDLADADAILVEVVRRHGVNPSTSDMPVHAAAAAEIEKVNRANDFDSNPQNYGTPAEDFTGGAAESYSELY